MKKSTLIMIALLLLTAGSALAQDKLLPYNREKFEKTAKDVKQDDYNNMVKWALEVFQQYADKHSLTFTKEDYDKALNDKAAAEDQCNKLLKEKNDADAKIASLETEKSTGEANKKEHKRVVDSLNSIIIAKDKAIKKLEESNASVADKEKMLRAKDSIISVRNEEITRLQNATNNQDGILNKLAQDTAYLHQQIKELNDRLVVAQGSVDDLNRELTEKNNKLVALDESVANLSASIKQYQKAFEETESTINRIYTTNGNKRLVDMNVSELAEAESAWNGMKALIEATDQTLAKQLKQKVAEINLWKSAVEPMNGAKKYMKGKYKEDQRTTWIRTLNSLKLSGNRVTERDEMVTLLEDQKTVKENYDKIVRNLEDLGSIPDAAQLAEAKRMLVSMKAKLGSAYHGKNCYDKYDEAIDKIEGELDQKKPGINLYDVDKYKIFINDLKEMF